MSILVACVYVRRPVRDCWVKLGYFRQEVRDGTFVYFHGKQSTPQLSEGDVAKLVVDGTLVKLPRPVTLPDTETVWLDPDGNVYFADRDNAVLDAKKRFVLTLPSLRHFGLAQFDIIRHLDLPVDAILRSPQFMWNAVDGSIALFRERLENLFPGTKDEADYRHVRDAMIDRKIDIVTVNWCRPLTDFQSSVKAAVLDGIPEAKPVPRPEKDFHIIFERGTTLFRRLITCFPLFFTPRRREWGWGILPFGHHRHIDVLLHNKHPSIDYFVRANSHITSSATRHGRCPRYEIRPERVDDFILNFIEFSGSSGSVIHYKSDYIFGELLSNRLDLCIKNPSISRSHLKIMQEKFGDITKKDSFEFSQLADSGFNGHVSSSYVGDPGEIVDGINDLRCIDDYCVVRIPHGQNVPVGVGYTLSLLPRLMESSKDGSLVWEELLTATLRVLIENEETYTKMFGEIGIELDIAGSTAVLNDSKREILRQYRQQCKDQDAAAGKLTRAPKKTRVPRKAR